jgi:uncharacterized membrane protein YeaQ/YmgE (transglycosylase-associated protein family)
MMSVITWFVLGLIAGLIANKLMNRRGEGLSLDIVLGIVGAVVGGWFFKAVGVAGVTGLNGWSIVIAVVGSVFVLGCFHAMKGLT